MAPGDSDVDVLIIGAGPAGYGFRGSNHDKAADQREVSWQQHGWQDVESKLGLLTREEPRSIADKQMDFSVALWKHDASYQLI
ncbi:hypothetical protein WAI453_009452 [Rhynchosporium graminicola]